MQHPLTRGRLGSSSTSGFARRVAAASLQGLAVSAALFALLASAGCVGLTTKPLAPGGTGTSSTGSTGESSPGSISATPSTIAFGNVVVGTTNSATITLSNTGDASDTITKVVSSGSGFIYTGLPTPIAIGAGLKTSFTVSFQPSKAGSATGTMSVETSAATYKVSLTGTGVSSAPQVSPNTASLSFGSVTVGTPSSHTVILTNTGNADLKISSVTASGTGFTASGGSGVTLTPNQQTTVTVTFAPKAAGAATGGLAIASNATNSASVQLTGAGVTASSSSSSSSSSAKSSVSLNWDASSSVIGYNVYRGTISGGPYAKLNSSIDGGPSYTDSNVSSGDTYYYVVTSVDSSNSESAYSNQVSVTIPQ